jgi:hypothetical protein
VETTCFAGKKYGIYGMIAGYSSGLQSKKRKATLKWLPAYIAKLIN